jgi:hypothetical protein
MHALTWYLVTVAVVDLIGIRSCIFKGLFQSRGLGAFRFYWAHLSGGGGEEKNGLRIEKVASQDIQKI